MATATATARDAGIVAAARDREGPRAMRENYLAGVSVVVVVVFFSVSTGASVVVVVVVLVVSVAVGVVLLVVVFLEQPTMEVAPRRMRAARPVDLNMALLYRNPRSVSRPPAVLA